MLQCRDIWLPGGQSCTRVQRRESGEGGDLRTERFIDIY